MRPGVSFVAHPLTRVDLPAFCGTWPEMTAEYDRFISVARGRQALLDVGAYHGVYALTFCALNPGSRALAIEPSKRIEVAKANIILNGFERNIQLLDCAAGSSAGFLYARPDHYHVTAANGVTDLVIAQRALDEICAQAGFIPDMIKIDTEGYELEVLRGAKKLLSRRPPMMLEVHPNFLSALGHAQADIYDLLSTVGYRIEDIGGALFDRAGFCAQRGLFFHAVCC